MKRVVFLPFSFCPSMLFAQDILPSRSGDYCPGVNITFTVTLPGAQSVQSVTAEAVNVNPLVVQQPYNISVNSTGITFNFVGRFTDNNNKQTFRVRYTSQSRQSLTWDATYTKIRSLLQANPFSQIQPSPASITAQRCQIQTFSISFPNVSYGNPWEVPPISYGTVTNYEYLLPQGWSMNGITSNGSSWIAGDNSESITSNASSGNGGFIRIRPINTQCGSGLKPGQQAQIPISRPRPSLSISGNEVICSGTANYSISGPVPPGATVCWSISSPTGAAIIPAPPYCGATLPVTFNSVGRATITATVTDCIESYTLSQKDIVLGLPPVDRFIVDGDRFDYTVNGPNRNYTVCPSETLDVFPNIPVGTQGVIGVLQHSWEYVSGNYQTFLGGNFYGASVRTSSSVGAQLQLRYRYRNACGWSGYDQVDFTNMNCDGGEEPYRIGDGEFDFTVSSNSSKNTATINTTGLTSNGEVRIVDLSTLRVVKFIRIDKDQKRAKLYVGDLNPGTYVVQVSTGGKSKSKQYRIFK